MPLPQNLNVILGAGVFGIVCAATLYVVEQYRQDRRRHAMVQDLARVRTEVAVLRKELDSLLALQNQKAPKRGRKSRKLDSTTLSSGDDFCSAIDVDSSDLEFYDLTDEETDTPVKSLESNIKEIDALLDEGSIVNLESCIETLENLCLESPNNPELLWRLGKTHYLLLLKTKNHEHLQMGIDACSAALKVEKESSAVHKWMAMLIGERTKIQPFKEKALDGMLFKKHLDEALRLDNTDPLLHHMLGRFSFDVADLKWYEKKIASALFELPPGTFEDALASFEEAERLCKTDWLENILFIAKCQIKLNRTTEALEVLQKAELIQENNYLKDNEVDMEIKELLERYRD